MGMFDWVDFETFCPKCKTLVNGFQSKNGPCVLKHLKPEEVRHFYSSCSVCKLWIEYEVTPRAGVDITRVSPPLNNLEWFQVEMKNRIKVKKQKQKRKK